MTRYHRPGAVPVRVIDAPDGHDVIIEGRLDVHTVPDIRDVVHEVIRRGPGELRLHLRHAEIGDATGLGVILHLHRRATREQRRLMLVDPSERTTRLLRGCRLDRILAVGRLDPSERVHGAAGSEDVGGRVDMAPGVGGRLSGTGVAAVTG